MRASERSLYSSATWLRVFADAVMVNAALAAALLVRYVVDVGLTGNSAPQSILQEYVTDYLRSFPILTVLSLIVFSVSGFYTRGRYYLGRYKALVIAQAVGVSYLLFGCVAFLSHGVISPPRSALAMAFAATMGLLLLSRLWSRLWGRATPPVEASPVTTAEPRHPPKTLVIGGAGYIGSGLLPKLLDRGKHVRLLDLFLFGHQPIAKVLGHPNLEIIHADFRHLDKLLQAMRGVDTVIHLGGIVGDPACSVDEDLTVDVNLIATRMIAEAAKGNGVRRFCFASSCSVYGANDEMLDERSSVNPISLYAQSKLASERVLFQLADSTFSPVVLRFGTVYGLSGRTRFDLVVNLLTAKAIVEGRITVFGGAQWRPFLHVDDAALAIQQAVEAPAAVAHGEVFNVGSHEQNYQLGDLAQLIRRLVPSAEVVDMGAGTDFRNYRVDFSKITNLLGFRPQWTLEAGVRQVIAALDSGAITDYRLPIYSNVKHLHDHPASQRMRSETGWAHQLIKQEGPPEPRSQEVGTR